MTSGRSADLPPFSAFPCVRNLREHLNLTFPINKLVTTAILDQRTQVHFQSAFRQLHAPMSCFYKYTFTGIMTHLHKLNCN